MNQQQITDAFQAFFTYWKEKTPHANEYLPFDLMEFFKAGIEVARELAWHGPEEKATMGRTIVAHDNESGETEVSYGGGRIQRGKWAYAEDVFSSEMMSVIREREAEIEAWLEHERQREPEIY